MDEHVSSPSPAIVKVNVSSSTTPALHIFERLLNTEISASGDFNPMQAVNQVKPIQFRNQVGELSEFLQFPSQNDFSDFSNLIRTEMDEIDYDNAVEIEELIAPNAYSVSNDDMYTETEYEEIKLNPEDIPLIEIENNSEHFEVISPANEECADAVEEINESELPVNIPADHRMCHKCGEFFPSSDKSNHCGRPEEASSIPKKLHLLGDRMFVQSSNLYICDRCGMFFACKEEFTAHEQTHENNIKCSKCQETFNDENELELHSAESTNILYCLPCDAYFWVKCAYSRHLRMHSISNVGIGTEKSEIPSKCDPCDRFDTSKELQDHSCAQNSVKLISCEHCGSEYSTKSDLMRHLQKNTISPNSSKQNYSNKSSFPCNQCNETFKAKCRLRKHELEMHVDTPNQNTENSTVPKKSATVNSNISSSQKLKVKIKPETSLINDDEKNTEFQDTKIQNRSEDSQRKTRSFSYPMKENCDVSMSQVLGNSPFSEVSQHLKCAVSSKSFASQKNEKLHRVVHEREGFATLPSPMTYLELLTKISESRKPFICDICEKSFRCKQVYIEHYLQHTGEKPFACNVCDLRFIRERNLQCHLEKHKKNNELPIASLKKEEEKSNDDFCNNVDNYSETTPEINVERIDEMSIADVTNVKQMSVPTNTTYSVQKRISRASSNTSLKECSTRKNGFARKNKTCIRKQQNKKYECALCSKLFYKRNLILQHLTSFHCSTTFECAWCSKLFYRRYILVRHLKTVHSSNSFECHHCTQQFQVKTNLVRHLRSCRFNPQKQKSLKPINSKSVSNVNRFTCGICNLVLNSKFCITTHYRDVHEITFEIKTLVLKSYKEFEEWKSEIENQTIARFIKQRSATTKTYHSEEFVCHRSSINRTLSRRKFSKRFPKQHGSKKLNTFCPAEIVVRINKSDGACVICFTNTHIGHSLNDPKELRHIYLTKQERMRLAERLKDGISRCEIRKQELSSESKNLNSRLSILRTSDISNIAASLMRRGLNFFEETELDNSDVVEC